MTADLTPTTDAIQAAIEATILAGADEPSDRDRELAHLYAPGIVRGLAPVARETLTRLLDLLAERDATIAQLTTERDQACEQLPRVIAEMVRECGIEMGNLHPATKEVARIGQKYLDEASGTTAGGDGRG